MRDQLFQRDDLIKKATLYSIKQEHTILELRSFIEQYNIDLVKAMEIRNLGSGRPQYISSGQHKKNLHGKVILDRMISMDKEHLFEIYTSIIQKDMSGESSYIRELKMKI